MIICVVVERAESLAFACVCKIQYSEAIYFYDLLGNYDSVHRIPLFIIIFTITEHHTLNLLLETLNNII